MTHRAAAVQTPSNDGAGSSAKLGNDSGTARLLEADTLTFERRSKTDIPIKY